MKQVVLELRSGELKVLEVPAPGASPDCVLIASKCSLISPGTERMLVEFAKSNLAGKARRQPRRVQEAIQKIRTDGIATTLGSVKAKLDQPMALGYCNVGTVLQQEAGFQPGDRVASNGPHAGIVCVPKNLVAKIPDDVDDQTAAFTVLGAVALQGVRLIKPALGERFVVIGLGLIGLLTVQILIANGCLVLGMDHDRYRLEIARSYGAQAVDLSLEEHPEARANLFTERMGVDGVLITAATTSSEPVAQAARMCRKRGRIVLVGASGLKLNRADFYEKELSFQVSCSYGPGRHEPGYELHGNDYPPAFVRWTAQRNFQTVLELIASGRINVSKLVAAEFPITEASTAYDRLVNDRSVLGMMLHYDQPSYNNARTISLPQQSGDNNGSDLTNSAPVIGFIGAGNHASRSLIKSFAKTGSRLDTIVSLGGLKAAHAGRRFGFSNASSDAEAVMSSSDINTIVVCSRHDTHARFVMESLKAGKHVFVEKPLCMEMPELETINTLAARPDTPMLHVGFNRRFAPMIVEVKRHLDPLASPKTLIMMVNAGFIPGDHWAQDIDIGGGRILGEACHFIDLLRYLAGAPISGFDVKVTKYSQRSQPSETVIVSLAFADGSIGVVNYFANGHKVVGKERLEAHCDGRTLLLENYRRLRAFGFGHFTNKFSWLQDKGHVACAQVFCEAIRVGGPAPIPLAEIIEVSRVSIEAANRAG